MSKILQALKAKGFSSNLMSFSDSKALPSIIFPISKGMFLELFQQERLLKTLQQREHIITKKFGIASRRV